MRSEMHELGELRRPGRASHQLDHFIFMALFCSFRTNNLTSWSACQTCYSAYQTCVCFWCHRPTFSLRTQLRPAFERWAHPSHEISQIIFVLPLVMNCHLHTLCSHRGWVFQQFVILCFIVFVTKLMVLARKWTFDPVLYYRQLFACLQTFLLQYAQFL